jgi:Mce-associated membrane protein
MMRISLRRRRVDDTNDTVCEPVDGASSTGVSSETDESPIETDEPQIDAADEADASASLDDDAEVDSGRLERQPRAPRWQRVLVYGLLPGLAMAAGGGAAYLKWLQTTAREAQSARTESVQAATDGTIKILSYSPESVDHDLDAARARLTGTFRDAYTQLTHDVVIPGSKEKKISAVATVPAATSLSASPDHAVVMVFVNQSITVGNDPPSSSASTVRITLSKSDNRWLISDFTPI